MFFKCTPILESDNVLKVMICFPSNKQTYRWNIILSY